MSEVIDPKASGTRPVRAPLIASESPQGAASSSIRRIDKLDRVAELALVERAKAGDRTAFRTLYEAYFPRARMLALRVVRNPAEAEDIAQDAFVRAFESLHRFEANSAFYTWLYRIVMNRAIDVLRRKRNAAALEWQDEGANGGTVQDMDIHPRYLNAKPYETLARKQILEIVNKTLAEMSEPLRVILSLREFHGLSYDEIAKTLDIPAGTVMSRLFHARKKLQEALSDFAESDTGSL